MPTAVSIKTLIVDDQQTMRSLIRTSLRALGITQTREAPDGEEGLRALISAPCNLVITDFNMPKLDGLGLLRAIRAHGPTSKTAVIMLTGPTPATKKVLDRAGLTVDDIDLFEINEAFASVVLKFQKDLNIPDEKLNVNGGAIAMGHPLGATGAMITGTMVDELERRGAKRALVTLCIGGGMGVATIIERV